jgi:hypothetical protein
MGQCLQGGGGTWSRLLSAFDPPPPDVSVDQKDKKSSGIHFGWLTTNFDTCPEDAVVQRYALSFLLHMDDELHFSILIQFLCNQVVEFLFLNSSGNTISWLVLLILCFDWDVTATYSWGSAALTWLYRALCDGYTRTGANANLGGCATSYRFGCESVSRWVDCTVMSLRYSLTFLFHYAYFTLSVSC